jgi:hypothetical protein
VRTRVISTPTSIIRTAQFIAVCSAQIRAEALRSSSPFSSQSHENREAALRYTRILIYQLQLTTKSDKLSVKDLIPLPKPGGHHRELDMRAVVNAIFYVVDGSITWRMLPHEYPQWPSVYWYCSPCSRSMAIS